MSNRRFGVRWNVSVKENPKGVWSGSPYLRTSKMKVLDDYGSAVARIKSTIHRYFGPCAYESKVTDDNKVILKFKMPSMRAWMDGMLTMKRMDKNRENKWVPKEACVIGATISQMLFSPYSDAEIEVYALVDDTLPPEGEMTEKELEIIYGK